MANFLDANDYLESHYLAKNPFWQAIIWQKYLWQAVFLARSEFYVIQNQWNHLEIQSFQGTKNKCPTLQNLHKQSLSTTSNTYGLSINTSKIPSKFFSNENKKLVFPEK